MWFNNRRLALEHSGAQLEPTEEVGGKIDGHV